MNPDDYLAFYQYLFAAAWTDGSLGAPEASILRKLLAEAPGGAGDAEVVEGWFSQAPAAPDWSAARGDAVLRESLVRSVMEIAAADGAVNLSEMRFVDALRREIGMDEGELHRIQVEVEKSRAT